MNEKENNAVELKDPQLEKVSGGDISKKSCPTADVLRNYSTCSLSEKGTLWDCNLCKNIDHRYETNSQ